MILLLRVLSRLPMPLLYLLSNALAFTAYQIKRYRRDVVFQNLENSFPDKSPAEIEEIAAGFYRNLADLILESIKAITISREQLVRRVRFVNLDLVDAYQREGQPMIMVTIHQCNWEWVLLSGCIQLSIPIEVGYHPLRDGRYDRLMLKVRSRFGGNVVPAGKMLREMRKRRDVVRVCAMLADQKPPPGAKAFWASFLNQETPFVLGPQRIARMFGYPVIFLETKRARRGHYEVTLVPVAEPPYTGDGHEIIEAYIREAERVVLEAPSHWLWSHQ